MNSLTESKALVVRDPYLRPVIVTVLVVHALFLVYSIRAIDPFPKIMSQERFIVKTVTFNEKKLEQKIIPTPKAEPVVEPFVEKENVILEEATPPEIQEEQEKPVEEVQKTVKAPKKKAAKTTPKKATPKKSEVKKVEKTTPRKEVVKPVKKAPEPKKKVTPEKPKVDPAVDVAKVKQKALLESAQKSMSKVSKLNKSSQSSALATTPAAIGSLHFDAVQIADGGTMNARELGYRDELASRLKLLLSLPEHGEVKIKLTLNSTGKPTKVVIVSAQSNANQKYIEKTVPSLTFPPFGSNFSGHNEYTFLISLNNDL